MILSFNGHDSTEFNIFIRSVDAISEKAGPGGSILFHAIGI